MCNWHVCAGPILSLLSVLKTLRKILIDNKRKIKRNEAFELHRIIDEICSQVIIQFYGHALATSRNMTTCPQD